MLFRLVMFKLNDRLQRVAKFEQGNVLTESEEGGTLDGCNLNL